MQPYDSCRLIAINLFSVVKNPFTANAEIDWDKLYEISYEQLWLGDNLVDLEIEHVDRILEKIQNDPEPDSIKKVEFDLWNKIREQAKSGRRIGAGITALGDMIAALNLKYNDKEALDITEKVMKTKMCAELDATIDLAIARGTFEGYSNEIEYDRNGFGNNKFYFDLISEFPEQSERMARNGRRNVSWSTIAPTGSVSILTQTTSGCEPLFMPYYMRRKKINPNEPNVRVDFVDQNGDSWTEFAVIHPKFDEWVRINYAEDTWHFMNSDEKLLKHLYEQSPYYGSTANDIDWKQRIAIQSILQKYTTNAISSTLNLPETITTDEVSDIYMTSWENGLKGQTIYREGSRTGVLIANKNNESAFEYRDAPKRPKTLICDPYNAVSDGQNYHIFVGLLDNKPYEVFARRDDMRLDRDEPSGTLTKTSKGAYKFESNNLIFENVLANMTHEQEIMTRLISTALRHGADIKFIVEQLSKTEGSLTSFGKVIARILKKYIPDGSKSTITCQNCGSSNVVFEEGCNKCLDCGSSKCG